MELEERVAELEARLDEELERLERQLDEELESFAGLVSVVRKLNKTLDQLFWAKRQERFQHILLVSMLAIVVVALFLKVS